MDVPARVSEYAEQAVAYVRRALGVALEYDSNTLPLLDHYLRTVPADQPAATALVIATAGAYFGEVVRRHLGGRWEVPIRDNGVSHGNGQDLAVPPFEGADWRMVLPTGISFSPAGFAAAAIAQADLDDFDSEIEAPPRIRPHLQQALDRMGELTVEEYYSLCGRLDTLEHVHEVLVAVAAQMMGNNVEDVPEQTADEPSGPVN
jgi:hypothetical protein